jgi:hypothetical protein
MENESGRRLSVSFSPPSGSWSTLLLRCTILLLLLGIGGPVLFVLLRAISQTLNQTAMIIFFVLFGGLMVGVVGPLLYSGMGESFFDWLWTWRLHTTTVTVENGAVTFTETPLYASGSTTTIPGEALDEVKVEQGALSLVQESSRSTGPRSDQREIWVAGDLDNEAEAEWVADRIRQAAEQQAAPA